MEGDSAGEAERAGEEIAGGNFDDAAAGCGGGVDGVRDVSGAVGFSPGVL